MAIRYGKAAFKVLARLDKTRRLQVPERLRLLNEGDNRNVKPMKGEDTERLRLGQLRVIFRRVGNDIEVIEIGFRGDIYKGK